MASAVPVSRVKVSLRWLHRWAGLTLGVVLTVVCVSGSLLLFQPQYFRWAHGDLIPDDLPQQVGSIDAWVENARAAVPGLDGPIAIWAPYVEHNVSRAGMLVFAGQEPGGLGNMGFVGVLVAPATGTVLGVIDIDRSPAYAPLFLHRDLWAGATGRAIIGVSAIAGLIMLLAGIYLWWPARARLARKLSPRPWRATFTRARGLHDWSGIWTVPILLLLTATGIYLVKPDWVAPLLETIPASAAGAPVVETRCSGAMAFDEAIARARALVPGGVLKALYPVDGAWEVVVRAGDSAAIFAETHLVADLDCGTVAVESSPQARAPRDSVEMWLISLHDGTALGTAGVVLFALIGLVPAVLLWSGVRMWLRGRRARFRR